ncbi:MAG: YIP1 family protein [Acidimicrobiia bacterium]|nr:YIP1 family protein [Acidimicrobiia bacterium]MDH3396838.1 YIP1 family protein [Acidimicrobiia bacterium]MDH5614950.1 YIP1 family protein [Acidimicrobiia bacterium]
MLFNQMFRAARLDRKLYTELFFDSYATGNAVVVVALVYAVIYLGFMVAGVRFDLIGFLWFLFGGLVGWLIAAGALWLASTKVFSGRGQGATAVRLSGFAHTPLIFIAFAFVSPVGLAQGLAFLALVWFGLGLALAARAMFDLDTRQSALSALIAIAIWVVVQVATSFGTDVLSYIF